MATIEQVERLREKANVSYDDAKTALDASGGDLLDAMIYLERMGKIEPPENNGTYSTVNQMPQEPEQKSQSEDYYRAGETFSGLMGRFFKWLGRIIAKGNKNTFEVTKNNQTLISLPVTVLVLLLLFAFWVVVPLIIIGLFFGCRYMFRGSDFEGTCVNKMMDSAANAAENLKKEINEDK
jgi:fatty acid desaturase